MKRWLMALCAGLLETQVAMAQTQPPGPQPGAATDPLGLWICRIGVSTQGGTATKNAPTMFGFWMRVAADGTAEGAGMVNDASLTFRGHWGTQPGPVFVLNAQAETVWPMLGRRQQPLTIQAKFTGPDTIAQTDKFEKTTIATFCRR